MNVTLKLPETLREQERDITQFLCAKLYEAGKVTLSQGARCDDRGRCEFLDVYPIIDVLLLERKK